jgi:hypothetical protein
MRAKSVDAEKEIKAMQKMAEKHEKEMSDVEGMMKDILNQRRLVDG